MARRQRDPKREAYWREVLSRQHGSGLTIRAFCRREHLAEPSFHAWRRNLKQREQERLTAVAGPRPAFVPVVVPEEESGTARDAGGQIVIELRGGRVMRLPVSMPAEQLARLVHAIEGLPPHAAGVP